MKTNDLSVNLELYRESRNQPITTKLYDEEKDIKPFLDRVLKEGLSSRFMNSKDGIDISERILEERFLNNYEVLLKSNILNFMEDVKNKFPEEFL